MKIKELSEKTGRSRSYIYKKAKELGCLPTIEELRNVRRGRPPKYFNEIESISIPNPIDKKNNQSGYYWSKIPMESIILDPNKENYYLSIGLEREGRIVKRTNLYSFTPGDEGQKRTAQEYAYSDWIVMGIDQEPGGMQIEIFKLTKIN